MFVGLDGTIEDINIVNDRKCMSDILVAHYTCFAFIIVISM